MEETPLKALLRKIKYQLVLKFSRRKNRVYTQFFRFPHQHKVLVERILPSYSEKPFTLQNPVEIVVFACCTGAEVYSLAYTLSNNFPNMPFRIRAFDIVEDAVEQARARRYSKDEVYSSPFIKEEQVQALFDRKDQYYLVKDTYAANIEFNTGDMLDAAFISSLGKADMVFAQNVLFHLPVPSARKAFENLALLLREDSTLFINGMDTDMRIKLTKKHQLQPVDYLIEEIHNDARVDRGSAWAGTYVGREPFSRNAREWVRKYCTIYCRVAS